MDGHQTALERSERTVDYARRNGSNQVHSHGELVRRGMFGDTAKVGAVDIF